MNCRACGAPGALRVGVRWRCGNPACARYDSRLAGLDAERPAIADAGKREAIAALLTPPRWVRWISGLMFGLPGATMLWGWWTGASSGIEWAVGGGIGVVLGVMIIGSGRAGGAIARETVARRRLREDLNLGCGFGLVVGVIGFALGSLLVVPLVSRFNRAPGGVPLAYWMGGLIAVVVPLATFWGLRRARWLREHPEAGQD